MASDLIIEVCTIDAILPHTNSDNLEIAQIKGWRVIVKKGENKVGDRVIYFPPETMLPEYTSRSLGIYKYLKGSDVSNKRIGQIKLRGEASLGLIIPIDPTWEEKQVWEIGKDVLDFFGAQKYQPPVLATNNVKHGITCKQNPLFIKYTDIQNLRHFPKAFTDGEEVIVTEKIHGQNLRFGMINGEWVAGSHNFQKGRPEREKISLWKKVKNYFDLNHRDEIDEIHPEMHDPFWYPYVVNPIHEMINDLSKNHKIVILFGESYGTIQKGYGYDCPKGQRARLRAFDLYIDGKYLNFDDFKNTCDAYSVLTVPVLARIPYTLDAIKALSEGDTTLGASHIREGVVVKPVIERQSNEIKNKGRLILKYVSDSYLCSKGHEEGDTTDV